MKERQKKETVVERADLFCNKHGKIGKMVTQTEANKIMKKHSEKCGGIFEVEVMGLRFVIGLKIQDEGT